MDSVQICFEVFLEVASLITCESQPQLVRVHAGAGNRELIVLVWIQQSHSFGVSGVSHIMSGFGLQYQRFCKPKWALLEPSYMLSGCYFPHSFGIVRGKPNKYQVGWCPANYDGCFATQVSSVMLDL